MSIAVHWFRRDLRLEDNTALFHALSSDLSVLPVFIFDEHIINELPKDDARITFIYQALINIDKVCKKKGSALKVFKGKPVAIWKKLISEFDISAVYTNKDFEPYAIDRDKHVEQLLRKSGISFHRYKDQVIFEENEIVKKDGSPYTVYTPYAKRWLERFKADAMSRFSSDLLLDNLYKIDERSIPAIKEFGFEESKIQVSGYCIHKNLIENYEENRDYPARNGTSLIGPYLRFGLISIRNVIRETATQNTTFLKELIWREFFMQILFHFPNVIQESFKSKYENIKWQNDENHFQRWCVGQTGYPIVDAGMRELNTTGFMHNRVRMVVASFLCKHLLIDWRWGEAYFATRLLDYELSSNNGNWQWAAGCGCDAAPYFRVFNPYTQQQKFDPNFKYIKNWVPEFGTPKYADPIVDHKTAREKAIITYKKGLQQY